MEEHRPCVSPGIRGRGIGFGELPRLVLLHGVLTAEPSASPAVLQGGPRGRCSIPGQGFLVFQVSLFAWSSAVSLHLSEVDPYSKELKSKEGLL